MGRINVKLDDDLHEQLRLRKAETGEPIRKLVNDALAAEYGDE